MPSALARRIDYTYDELNRQTLRKWIPIGGGSAVNTLTFTYDAADNLLIGQDQNGIYTFTYDNLNRNDTQKDVWSKTLTFSYDAVGNRTKVQDSFSGVETSTYNAANLLETRRFSGVGAATPRIDFTYNEVQQRSTAKRYSDLTATTMVSSTTFSYDTLNRIQNVQQREGTASLFSNATFTYDAASRLTAEILNGTTTSYGYDAINQVTTGGAVTYAYDASGNRNGNGQSIGTGNRLNSDGTWTYTYDDEGNLIRRTKGVNAETWDYTYDHRNQLTSATKKATQAGAATLAVTFTYDVFGNRIKQDLDADGAGGGGTTTTKFAYDGIEVWADLNSDETLQTRYIRGDAVDELFARISSGGTAAWYITDRMGSVRNILSSTGGILGTIAYDAFGQITTDTTGGNGDRWKWTGREWQSDIGLQYNRWRYYDTASGHFTSEDPYGLGTGDLNLFRYTVNSPTHFRDPVGTNPLLVNGLAGAVAGMTSALITGGGWQGGIGGFVGGFIGGAISTVSPTLGGIVAGAVSSGITSVLNGDDGRTAWFKMFIGAVSGGVAGWWLGGFDIKPGWSAVWQVGPGVGIGGVLGFLFDLVTKPMPRPPVPPEPPKPTPPPAPVRPPMRPIEVVQPPHERWLPGWAWFGIGCVCPIAGIGGYCMDVWRTSK